MWGLLRRFPMSQYLRPLWLFWSGPGSVPLDALCQMYLARFGIEHFFRFAKQRLGLLCAKSPTLPAGENGRWGVALARPALLLGGGGGETPGPRGRVPPPAGTQAAGRSQKAAKRSRSGGRGERTRVERVKVQRTQLRL